MATRRSATGGGTANALADYDAAIRLRPDLARAYAERGWSLVSYRIYRSWYAAGKARPLNVMERARLQALGIPDRPPGADEAELTRVNAGLIETS